MSTQGVELDGMGSLRRSHRCGEVQQAEVGDEVILAGWVHNRRDHGGVIFVDSALLDVRPFRYPLDNLFWSVGPGLRYETFVGPLRFDWGTLINRADSSQSRFQWYLSVGHSF